MLIHRDLLSRIENSLFKNKVILIYGTRRVGKTTLINQLFEICEKQGKNGKIWNCEMLSVKQLLGNVPKNLENFKTRIKDYDFLILDEAQNVSGIGLALKIIHDELPQLQVIATGSSSFELANKVGEPLVGRERTFELYPFSINELYQADSNKSFFQETYLDKILRFGMYPSVWGLSEEEAIAELESIVNGYLYRDILTFESIKKADYIVDLLQCLALQVGAEVSYEELSKTLELSIRTIQKYIDLLKKCFVIFSLSALSGNSRNEIGCRRSRKIYFYDVGIRNALINNYNPMYLRNDVGAVWENFCVVELLKKAQREKRYYNRFFWRNYNKKEIDFIEEENGQFMAYELKYSNNRRVRIPRDFKDAYNPIDFKFIHKDNFLKELL